MAQLTEILKDVEVELNRFSKRLKAAKERLKTDNYAEMGCKETGALKRAALDLKNELTRITQNK